MSHTLHPIPSTAPVVVQHVWKRYQIGLIHHSLRDAIPAFWKRVVRRGQPVNSSGEEGVLWALKDVSFEVTKGEALGIIGHNGAGKSTILKLLCGISKPTKGTLAICGKLAALIEVGAGFHPDLTGRENIFLNGTIMGLTRQEIRGLFDQIVEFAELERFIDTPVKRYSSGMYVRLGFAIAAHVNPDVLLIDEVLSVGDMAFQQKCLRRIHELKQMGKTMVFISHNLNAVQRICDRALLLSYGEVVAQGGVNQVIAAYREQVVNVERRRFEKALARQAAQGVAGSGVRIESIKVLDAAGRPAETVKTGEQMTVEVGYACDRRIPHPTMTVSIDRVDGMLCHVAASQRNGNRLPALAGKGTLSLTYPAVTLLPNAYQVSVELSEEGRSDSLDSRKHGCFFSITSDQPEAGAVHLDHYWEWER